jgi:ABC-2 type transport system permease protein
VNVPAAAGQRERARLGGPGSYVPGRADAMRQLLWALLAIAQRDVIKLIRDRPRVAVNLAFPVMLIAGLGSVLQPTVGKVTGLNAVTLAFTGVLAATLFQSAAAGMISIVEDRENDFSREIFVTPVPRLILVGGKVAGETAVALCQGAAVVAFALAFGVRAPAPRLAALLLPGLACALVGGAFGLATIAVLPQQRSAMQIFQFLIIPQYVLGGVLVPVTGLPGWLNVLAWAMPMRYGVDLARAVFYAGTPGYGQVVAGGPALDAAVLAVMFVTFMIVGAVVFNHRERTR